MYCLNCGSQMAEGSKFCISCGTKYESGEPVQETAAQEAAVSVESTAAVEETAQIISQPAASQPAVSQPAAPQPVQQTAEPAQEAQSKTVPPAITRPIPQQPVMSAQQQNNMIQQTVSQTAMLLKPEKITPLPVWKYIGIFLIMGVPILGIVMVFVWAFGSSFNRNTKNYARAILITFLIMLVLTIVGYFTIWSNIQEIFNNLNLPARLPITD
jgi:hypothetical protein